MVPGRSNLSRKSLPIQSLSVVGLFELPRKLPIPIARCDGTAWYRLGAHEPMSRHRDHPLPASLTGSIGRSDGRTFLSGSVSGEAEDRDRGIAAANLGSDQVVFPHEAR